MTGLIVLLILIPIAIIVLLITILSRSSEQQKLTESLYDRIKHLSDEIAGLSKEIKNFKQPGGVKPVAEEKPGPKAAPAPVIISPKEEIKPVIIPEIRKQEIPKPVIEIKREEEVVVQRKEPPRF